MKQLLHLSSFIIVTLFMGNLFLISCQEENTEVASPSRPLLATMSSYEKDGTLLESETYRYDANGRLIEMINNDNYRVTLEYSPSKLTMKDYKEDNLTHSSVFELNAKGLYISSESNGYKTTTNTYDANGYRQLMLEVSDQSTYKKTFTVSSGNYVSITTESDFQPFGSAKMRYPEFFEKFMVLKSGSRRMDNVNLLKSASAESEIEKMDFVFYMDKINTIEHENIGIYFFGKQNKNLIKEELTTLSFNGQTYTSTVTYTYEYDSKGKITRQTEGNGKYKVFTYVE